LTAFKLGEHYTSANVILGHLHRNTRNVVWSPNYCPLLGNRVAEYNNVRILT